MLPWNKPGVAELADALDSKSSGTWYRVGSTPSSGTTLVAANSLGKLLLTWKPISMSGPFYFWCIGRYA